MAEGLQRWEKKTPERFHSSRHGEVYRVVEKFELRSATEAHTPQLSAVKRHRPVHALSREALEAQEVEEMKKYFKFQVVPSLNVFLFFFFQLQESVQSSWH